METNNEISIVNPSNSFVDLITNKTIAHSTLSAVVAPAHVGTDTPYEHADFDRAVKDMERALEGTRNHLLYTLSRIMGQRVAGGELDAATVESELIAAAMRAGLPRHEAERTFKSGFTAGQRHPRSAPEKFTTISSASLSTDITSHTDGDFRLITTGDAPGLYKVCIRKGKEHLRWLGACLHIKGLARDEQAEGWGIIVVWYDQDNKLHTRFISRALIYQGTREVMSILGSEGYRADPSAGNDICKYLALAEADARFKLVSTVGWHDERYVLPHTIIGDNDNDPLMLYPPRTDHNYAVSGTMEGWKSLAQLAIGNSRLTFALCVGFCGPIHSLCGMEGGGFHFIGDSSTGKTTALKVSASVWGSQKFIRSWRTTDNALEFIASQNNDGVLLIDEYGQVTPEVANKTAYMLANGQGKTRAKPDATLRNKQEWLLIFLSTGEDGLSEKLAEINKNSMAGQEVRMVNISADTGQGMGIFETIHDFTDSAAFSHHLQEQSSKHYGHAGPAFVEYLSQMGEGRNDALRRRLEELSQSLCTMTGASSQVTRVARRSALVALAGQLAVEAGILPFTADDVVAAVRTCLLNWVDDRGGIGTTEDIRALDTVKSFIEQHGASRLQGRDDEHSRVINRVGFKEITRDNYLVYYFFTKAFEQEVLKGQPFKTAKKALKAAGWLITEDSKRDTVQRSFANIGRARYYKVVIPCDN